MPFYLSKWPNSPFNFHYHLLWPKICNGSVLVNSTWPLPAMKWYRYVDHSFRRNRVWTYNFFLHWLSMERQNLGDRVATHKNSNNFHFSSHYWYVCNHGHVFSNCKPRFHTTISGSKLSIIGRKNGQIHRIWSFY